jgi:ABC-2 type transport system ATP-binding protein
VSSPPPLLVARGVTFGYGTTPVLAGLDLTVAAGEIYGLLGTNGAGKSTLIQLILGLLGRQAGTVEIAGFDPAAAGPEARRRVAYVPESVSAYPQLSGLENLRYFLRLARAETTDEATLAQALTAVGLPEEAWRRRVVQYSKGMRQKLVIAVAVARRVPLLLLDEPTSGLDPAAMAEFNQLLRQLKERGVATLLVSHDLLGVFEVADRLGFLARGRVVTEVAANGPAERFDLNLLRQLYTEGRGDLR